MGVIVFINSTFRMPIVKDIYMFLVKHDFLLKSIYHKDIIFNFSDVVNGCGYAEDAGDNLTILVNPKYWADLNFNEKCFIITYRVLYVLFSFPARENELLSSKPEKLRFKNIVEKCQEVSLSSFIKENYFNLVAPENLPILQSFCDISGLFSNKYAEGINKGMPFEGYYDLYIDIFHNLSGMIVSDGHYYNLYIDTVHNDSLNEMITSDNSDTTNTSNSEMIASDNSHTTNTSNENESPVLDENTSISPPLVNSNLIDEILSSMDFKNNEQKLIAYGQSRKGELDNRSVVEKIRKTDSLKDLFKVAVKKTVSSKEKKTTNYQWYGFDRRTSPLLNAMSPNMSLPVKVGSKSEHKDKSRILLYLDVSGSCVSYSRRLAELAVNLPSNKFKIDLFAFADNVVPAYINKSKKGDKTFLHSGAGYGTDIMAVLDHHRSITGELKKNTPPYDAVFVLTDGFYENIKRLDSDKFETWHFFFVSDYHINCPLKSNNYPLSIN